MELDLPKPVSHPPSCIIHPCSWVVYPPSRAYFHVLKIKIAEIYMNEI
jgi:hypothetical protein